MVPPGSWVLGRSALATIRADDPTLEPFHLDLRLPGDPAELPTWVQLAGRRPVLSVDDGLLAVGAGLVRLRRVPEQPSDRTWPVETARQHAGSLAVRSARVPVPALDELAAHRDGGLGLDQHATARTDRTSRSPGDDVSRPPDAATALVPAVVTCAATAALAMALDQPMLVAMAAVGASVAGVLWALAWARHRRRVRRAAIAATERTVRVAAAAERRRLLLEVRHRLAHPGIEGTRRLLDTFDTFDTLDTPDTVQRRLWERRAWHDDAFVAVVGTGTVELDAPTSDEPPAPGLLRAGSRSIVLETVPIVVDLGPGARLACTGEFAEACVRSMLAQLATTTGPADWLLVVVSDRADRADRWAWLRDLPHLVTTDDGDVVHDDGAATALLSSLLEGSSPSAPTISSSGRADQPPMRHVVVVTDDADAVAVRTSAIRRLLHARPDAALLGSFGAPTRRHTGGRRATPAEEPAGAHPSRVPALCVTVVATARDGTVRVKSSDAGGTPVGNPRHPVGGSGRLTGLGRGSARSAVEVLTGWVDPEAPADDERRLPADVLLDDAMAARGAMLERTAIAARWRHAGVDAAVHAPIGVAADGVVELDLVGDGPHGLVAGTTGSGKSELLRTVVVSSCAAVPPDQLSLVLVDFKGGATFDGLQALPHVVGVVTDLEPHLTDRVLRSLRAEVTSREHLLRSLGAADLPAARASTGTSVVPRLVVIVDEFAALALDHPNLLHALVDIARRGRSLGVHLLLATQRPNGVVSDEIRTNTALRIALRLHDPGEAIDVVGDAAPASFRRSSAGRAVMRLGPGELVTFQSARVASAERAVTEIAAAADAVGIGRPARPWCDPLPDRLDLLDLLDLVTGETEAGRSSAGVAMGWVDLPDEQRQTVLAWQPSDGAVLVVGSPGYGVTTTLASLAVRSVGPHTSCSECSDPEIVVLDAHGDRRWDEVAALPHCAGVIRLHERERLDRALLRASSPPPAGGRLVVIDGIALVRRDLEQPGRADLYELFEALVLATPPGVTLLIGAHGSAGLSPALVSRCARRWVLHLHDPADGAVFGLRISEVPPPIAGRMVDATTHHEAQLLGWPTDEITATPDAGTPVARIVALPDVVAASDMPSSSFDGDLWSPVLGIAHRSLQPVGLDVPSGEHLLVIGPPRSGRTEVLSQLRRGWSDARPDAAQVVVSPRRFAATARADAIADALTHLHHELAAGRAALLVVDDAELVPDPDGRLAALVASPPEGLAIVAACRPDAVRAHGHWVAMLRRSRRGVLMAASSDLDADALGATLPRHPPLAPRPGLCWLVADGEAVLVQAATATP